MDSSQLQVYLEVGLGSLIDLLHLQALLEKLLALLVALQLHVDVALQVVSRNELEWTGFLHALLDSPQLFDQLEGRLELHPVDAESGDFPQFIHVVLTLFSLGLLYQAQVEQLQTNGLLAVELVQCVPHGF